MIRYCVLVLLVLVCSSASAQVCVNGVCYTTEPTSVVTYSDPGLVSQSEVVEYQSTAVTYSHRQPIRNLFGRLRTRVKTIRQAVFPRLSQAVQAVPPVTFQNVCESEFQCSDVQTVVFSSSSRPLQRVAAKRALRVQGRMTAMMNFAATGVNTRMQNLLSSVFPRAWFNLR